MLVCEYILDEYEDEKKNQLKSQLNSISLNK